MPRPRHRHHQAGGGRTAPTRQDFFSHEPNAKQLAAEYHLTGIHPAYISATGSNYPPTMSYARRRRPTGFRIVHLHALLGAGRAGGRPGHPLQQPGPLPAFLGPSTNYGAAGTPTGNLGIDQINLHRLP